MMVVKIHRSNILKVKLLISENTSVGTLIKIISSNCFFEIKQPSISIKVFLMHLIY